MFVSGWVSGGYNVGTIECHLSQAETTGQRPLPVEEVVKSWPLDARFIPDTRSVPPTEFYFCPRLFSMILFSTWRDVWASGCMYSLRVWNYQMKPLCGKARTLCQALLPTQTGQRAHHFSSSIPYWTSTRVGTRLMTMMYDQGEKWWQGPYQLWVLLHGGLFNRDPACLQGQIRVPRNYTELYRSLMLSEMGWLPTVLKTQIFSMLEQSQLSLKQNEART